MKKIQILRERGRNTKENFIKARLLPAEKVEEILMKKMSLKNRPLKRCRIYVCMIGDCYISRKILKGRLIQ